MEIEPVNDENTTETEQHINTAKALFGAHPEKPTNNPEGDKLRGVGRYLGAYTKVGNFIGDDYRELQAGLNKKEAKETGKLVGKKVGKAGKPYDEVRKRLEELYPDNIDLRNLALRESESAWNWAQLK